MPPASASQAVGSITRFWLRDVTIWVDAQLSPSAPENRRRSAGDTAGQCSLIPVRRSTQPPRRPRLLLGALEHRNHFHMKRVWHQVQRNRAAQDQTGLRQVRRVATQRLRIA